MEAAGFFDLSDGGEAASAGQSAEATYGRSRFQVFRGALVAELRRSPRREGGRLPFDPVLMFEILVIEALYSLSDDATEFQIKNMSLASGRRASTIRDRSVSPYLGTKHLI